MLSIIKTGGKQYLVKKGDKLKVEKLEGEIGSTITLSEILLIDDEGKLQIGTPVIEGATMTAKILDQKKAPKVSGVKHKAKKRYKKSFGHRQLVTEIEIL